MANKYREKCKRIWKAYKMYAELCLVERSGFILTGLAMMPWMVDSSPEGKTGELFRLRGESILEHQAKVAVLCSMFMSNFPEFFGENEMSKESLGFEPWQLIAVCDAHDVGELATGDIPDDGNPLHGTKDNAEFGLFQEFAQMAYGQNDIATMAGLFAIFQRKDSLVGKAIYVLDKIEAVLTLIYMESKVYAGYIMNKPHPTEQDKYFMRITGSDCATDCWAAHMVAGIRDFPETIKAIALELLTIAIEDVRGEKFSWQYEDCLPWMPDAVTQ